MLLFIPFIDVDVVFLFNSCQVEERNDVWTREWGKHGRYFYDDVVDVESISK